MCYLCIRHWQDFLYLFIFLEVSWEKEEEMGHFESQMLAKASGLHLEKLHYL
jgi:hypothetical protein